MKKWGRTIKTHLWSLRMRMVLLVTFTLAMLVLFLLANNLYAVNVVRNNAYESTEGTLRLVMEYIDDAFDAMDNYWIGLQDTSNFFEMINPDSRLDFYTAKARLTSDMAGAVQSYNYIDSLFVYTSQPLTCNQNGDAGAESEIVESQFFDAVKYTMHSEERAEVRQMIISYVNTLKDGKVSGQWEAMTCNGHYYLVRMFRLDTIYMGGCVRVSGLLEKILEDGPENISYLTFFQNHGMELGTVLPEIEDAIDIPSTSASFRCPIENSDFLVISQPSDCGDFSLVAFIREQNIIEGLGVLQKIIIILSGGLIVFAGLFTTAVRRWVLRPMGKLYQAMNRLKEGDLTVRLGQEPSPCREFELVNETFDSMIKNIETLKIDVYEEKMSHQKTQLRFQKAELQYMKLQVNPHFYINCLNIIHNLSIMNKNDLVREMTTYLGNHLRYTMEGTTVDALYKELDYVENYLHIQELRFPESLSAYIEIAPDVRQVRVPPLIIQTFVENTVKYQVVAGEHTQIYIVACRCDPPKEHYISIEIWDSGDGYAPDILEKLNSGSKIIDAYGGAHFGIRNVVIRLHLIYNGKERIVFDNHWETGGAHVTIELPDQAPET